MLLGTWPALGRISAVHRVSSRFLRYRRGAERGFHDDGRTRFSNYWLPTKTLEKTDPALGKEDAHDFLIRGGFIRQAYSGVFHMLPMGLRVQEKVERLIDRHMQSINASKVSLSSLSSQELWERSGRLNDDSDVFRFNDRKHSRFLLAPTHEEEITSLVGSIVGSYKYLPLRVYQISRKYRDEPRPRQGLLRGREFIMKDLYTFDATPEEAMKTYQLVRGAYNRLFDELKIPYLVAQADSGNMGGNLSHEYVLPSSKGEDSIISCSNCNFVYNSELEDGKAHRTESQSHHHTSNFATDDLHTEASSTISSGLWMGITRDRETLVRGWYPKYLMESENEPVERKPSSHAIKAIADAAGIDLDLSVENPLEQWAAQMKANSTTSKRPKVVDLYDSHMRIFKRPPLGDLVDYANCAEDHIEYSMLDRFPGTTDGLKLTKVQNGDKCMKCAEGSLTDHAAVELGHTFFLGTRYTEALDASVTIPETLLNPNGVRDRSTRTPMQMGCHGIGVSRMITAVADVLSDSKGLNWPRVIAPYEVVVLSMPGKEQEAETVYDTLARSQPTLDVILDDRYQRPNWKLHDADLIGYPVMVVVGKAWSERQMLEVQCRLLKVKEEVPLSQLTDFVQSLLEKL